MTKNHSYVCIPAHKLAAIIEASCPPIGDIRDNGCFAPGGNCLDCWKLWLKDGDDNG